MCIYAQLTNIITHWSDTKTLEPLNRFIIIIREARVFQTANTAPKYIIEFKFMISIGTACFVGCGFHSNQIAGPRLQSAQSDLLPIILS